MGAHTDETPQPHGKAPFMELLNPGFPQGQLQWVWLQSPLPKLLRAQPQAQPHDKSGQTLYQPQIHPLPFQIWCAAHKGSHPSLVSPWAQFTLAASTRIRDLGYPQQRKCDCCSRRKSIGQTSVSERLPLSGVWDGGQRLGHRRCPCARPPPHSRAVGQNAGAEHRKHLGERLT